MWTLGTILKYPQKIKHPFLWRTRRKTKTKFEQEFTIDKNLPRTQNYSAFKTQIKKSKNKYVIVFPNLAKDTLLVVPMPKRGKNFASLKDFIDNASKTQQKVFWRKVKQVANRENVVWVSTHGHGVPYLHVRISLKPKYYGNSKLKNLI